MINYEQLEELGPEDRRLYKKKPRTYWVQRRRDLQQEREQCERRGEKYWTVDNEYFQYDHETGETHIKDQEALDKHLEELVAEDERRARAWWTLQWWQDRWRELWIPRRIR